MKIYDEKHFSFLTMFTIYNFDNNGNELDRKTVSNHFIHQKKDNNHYIIIIINDGYDQTVYNFINVHNLHSNYHTRELYAQSLKLLYTFLELNSYDINNLTAEHINEYIQFISGINEYQSNIYSLTHRTNSTINHHLTSIRSFFKYAKIECEALNDFKFIPSHVSNHNIRYKVSKGLLEPQVDEPKYISKEQFKKLYEVSSLCKSKYNLYYVKKVIIQT